MVAAISRSLHYKQMLGMCVCDISNSDCMLKHCDNCPDPDEDAAQSFYWNNSQATISSVCVVLS